MFDVITIGSATRDVFLISKAFQIITSPKFTTGMGECVALGSKIEIEDMVLTTGGGGTNAAATFASLGHKTAVITRIGDDAPGADVLADMKRFNVDTKLVKTIKKGVTGYGTQLMTTKGERSVLVYRGVANDFSEKDIPWSRLKTKWIYMSSLAGNVALALRIVKTAKKAGVKVAYNPGSKELKQGIRAMEPILKHLALFNINLEEARLLTKSPSGDIKVLVQKLALPELTTVITDGARGAYAHSGDDLWFAKAHNDVKPISRTGAGDAFGSGLVSALVQGMSLDDALRVGTLNSESVILEHGAKNGILKKWPSANAMKLTKVRKIS